MPRPDPLRAEVVADEVEQLAADVQPGRGEEAGCRRQRHLLQRPVEAQQRVLEHVLALDPAPQAREAGHHRAGHDQEPLAGQSEEVGARKRVARGQPVQARLDRCRRFD